MTGSDDVTFRHLSSDADYEACLELQLETWGRDFREPVAPAMLKIAQKVSGIAAGAFRDERMIGFVYGLSGVRDGRLAHWSHMLAVDRKARGLGLGKRLKLFQRDYLLGVGVEVVYWSYDPLVARNANLNLNRLGARPAKYVVDMYGADTGSALHSALGTDRFVVAWEIGSSLVEDSIGGRASAAPMPSDAERLVNADWSTGAPRSVPDIDELATDGYWVEVPANIEAVKRRDLEEARRWRETTRAAIVTGMEAGLAVSGFAIGDPAGGEEPRFFYWLRRPEGAEG